MQQNTRPLKIGDRVPNFTAPSTKGEIKFHDYIKDHWCIFFSHPMDFTPVCTTELGEVQKLYDKGVFEHRNTKVLALSVDSLAKHNEWMRDITQFCGCTNLQFPVIADENRNVSMMFGMMDENSKNQPPNPLRCVFIIDNNMYIRCIMTYPPSVGRNMDEVVRVLDALQLHDMNEGKIVTPVNWHMGMRVLLAPERCTTEEAKKKYRDVHEMNRYYRMCELPKEQMQNRMLEMPGYQNMPMEAVHMSQHCSQKH